MKVGYLGPEASFGDIAAKQFFNGQNDVEFLPHLSHHDICCAVGKSKVEFGVVAIENVIDGAVNETVHAVVGADGHYGLKVCGETIVPVELFYLRRSGGCGVPAKVLSHSKALEQCGKLIRQLLEQGVAKETRSSTSEAAREASENPEVAAIASSRAAELYGLEYLQKESVADNPHNFTRFWILNKSYAERTGHDKTCFLINLKQEAPGALWRALGFFAQRGVNLLFMNWNPIPGKLWEYTFLTEFSGHIEDSVIDEAWQEFQESGISWVSPLFLGSYPDMTSK